MHPAQHTRHLAAAVEQSAPSTVSGSGLYSRLLVPVALVTVGRGREVYTDSRRLFDRLALLSFELKRTGDDGKILAVWQGAQHVSEAGVAALEAMLATVGLETFNRACKSRPGGARAIGSKYQWNYLGEYLGWEWERV